MSALSSALHRLAGALTASAEARRTLCGAWTTTYAQEDEALLAVACADLRAVRRVLRAYQAAAEAARDHKSDPKLAGHLRAEQRVVARFEADKLADLGLSYRAYALVLGGRR